MQIPNITNVALAVTTSAVASASVVIPLAITAIALLTVAVCSFALPSARRRHALLVLDRLIAFAAAVRGRSAGPPGGPAP